MDEGRDRWLAKNHNELYYFFFFSVINIGKSSIFRRTFNLVKMITEPIVE